MLHIPNSYPDQCVGVTGRREYGLHFRYVLGNICDDIHASTTGKTQLDKRLQRQTHLAIIDNCGVARNDAHFLEPVKSPFDCRGRKSHSGTNVAKRPSGILNEQIHYGPINFVDSVREAFHTSILPQKAVISTYYCFYAPYHHLFLVC